MKGLVTSSRGMFHTVRNEVSGVSIECRIRGKLRLKGARTTSPVAVGDHVEYEVENGEGVITAIYPRRNYVIRRSPNLSKEAHIIAANVDRAMVVVTLFEPRTNCEFIDRFLVSCEAYKIPATIILNKIDLALREPELLAEFMDIYDTAGYEILEVSATEGVNIDKLGEMLRGHTTLLSGNSGVGKSSLIKAVEPGLDPRTAEISDYHKKGRHTTTFSTMYPLSVGGFIIDTPGIKGFGLVDIDEHETWHYFPDLMKYASGCQYYNCTHRHEPGCAVEQALADGRISLSRYESYLKILEDDDKYRK